MADRLMARGGMSEFDEGVRLNAQRKPTGAIDDQMIGLAKENAALSEELHNLLDRISPVLRSPEIEEVARDPENPHGRPDYDDMVIRLSSLHDELSQRTLETRRMRNSIEDAISRCDL